MGASIEGPERNCIGVSFSSQSSGRTICAFQHLHWKHSCYKGIIFFGKSTNAMCILLLQPSHTNFLHIMLLTANFQDFMPKLVDFRYCVVEGKQTSYDNPRYYPSKKEGTFTQDNCRNETEGCRLSELATARGVEWGGSTQ